MSTDDLEVALYRAVRRRGKTPGGLPDRKALLAMEEPVTRLMGASVLFYDLATAVETAADLRPMGLIFLSFAMKREAERLYRLYHGHKPQTG